MSFPVAAALAAITGLGGIIAGKNGRKAIDPETLKRLFGVNAINDETIALFNNLINSPVGQQMMTQAAQTGQSFSNDLNAKLGQAGFAGGDAGSPIAAFTGAAGGEAAGNMQRSARAQLFSQALDAATQNVNNRAGIWAGSQQIQQQTPTFGEKLGGAITGAVGAAAPYIGQGSGVPKTGSIAANPGVPPDNGMGGLESQNAMMGTNSTGAFGAAGTIRKRKKRLGIF